MTEMTWTLLIICATIVFLAAIIADCIKSIKGRQGTPQKPGSEIRKHAIPPHKGTGESVVFRENGKMNTEIFKN